MPERELSIGPEIAKKENPEFIQLLETSNHEMGHVIVAQSCGWSVEKVSIEAKGNILGFTKLSAPAKDEKDLLLERAAISYGGQIAARMMGDTADGCSSDMSVVDDLARIAAIRFGMSEAQFRHQAIGIAHGALRSSGISFIAKRGQYLAETGKAA